MPEVQKNLMRLISGLLALLLLSLLSVPLIQAGESVFLRESLRARGMGYAHTAVANDEYVLFYNPAGLRSLQNNIYEVLGGYLVNNTKLSPSIPIIGGHGTIDTDEINIDEGGLGAITGKSIYIEGGLNGLSHLNSRWGWSLFNNNLVNVAIHNPVFPYLEGKMYTQVGAVGGFAMSFMDYQLDVGVAGKFVYRAGIDSTLHLTEKMIIYAIDGETDKSLTAAKAKGETKGVISPDVGATYHLEGIHNLSPKISVVVQNIGGMDFGDAGKIPMVINTGIATETEFGPFDFITAVDYHDLLNGQKLASDNNMFTERNLKIGFEVGWWKLANSHHFASFRLGRNGPYNSKGLSLNLWKFKLDLVSYSQETGGYAGEKEDKRWAFAMGLIF